MTLRSLVLSARYLSREECEAIAKRTLSFATADETRVLVSSTNVANTRFAVNQISTGGDSFDSVVTVIALFGKRSGSSSTNQIDDDGLRAAVNMAERIAGHDADRLLLKARDDSRFDHVIWADHATGLLLRVDVQVAGRTLESSGFSDVNIGVKPDAAAIYNELHRADGFRIVKPAIEHTRLDAEGWTMQAALLPAGFMALDCVRRALDLPGDAAGQANVLQAIWSDGITHVSLFIEPFQPQRHRSEGLTAIGATHTLTRRVNDMWLTAVGDVPPAALDLFMRALEHKT